MSYVNVVQKSILINICFIIDVTLSMKEYMENVLENMQYFSKALFNEIKLQKGLYSNIEYACILYSDIDYDIYNRMHKVVREIHVVPFTNNFDIIENAYVNYKHKYRGGDDAEDLAGALHSTINNIKWHNNSYKIALLYTDALGHGISNTFMEDFFTNGDPEGLDHIKLLKEMKNKNISLLLPKLYDTNYLHDILAEIICNIYPACNLSSLPCVNDVLCKTTFLYVPDTLFYICIKYIRNMDEDIRKRMLQKIIIPHTLLNYLYD